MNKESDRKPSLIASYKIHAHSHLKSINSKEYKTPQYLQAKLSLMKQFGTNTKHKIEY